MTQEELGGADTHAKTSGAVHIACDNEVEALLKVRDLVDHMPMWWGKKSFCLM